MLYQYVRLAALTVFLAVASSAQPAALPMKLVTYTEADPQERWVVFHLRDAAKAPELVSALVRAMDPKQNAGSQNPLRAKFWPPRISTPTEGQVVVDFDARVPGLAKLLSAVTTMAGAR
jgi:hypothetical protein